MCKTRDTSHLTKKEKQMSAQEAAGQYLVETVMCKLHCGTF